MVPLSALAALVALVADPAAPASPPTSAPAAEVPAVTTSTPPPAVRPILLVLDIGGDALADAERTELGEALTLLLAERLDLEVQSSRTLKDRVALVAEQQSVGCDTSACLAEIASAMGARFIVFGRVVVIGGTDVFRLEVFDDETARTLALTTVQGADVPALVRGLPAAVDALVLESAGELPVRTTTKKLLTADEAPGFLERPGADAFVGGLGLMGGGLVVGGLGLWGMLQNAADNQLLDDAASAYVKDPSLDNARAVADAREQIGSANLHLWGGLLSLGALTVGGISLVAGTLITAGGGLMAITTPPGEDR